MPLVSIPTFRETHYVYAMLCRDGDGPGYIKFGRSMRIGERLTALRTACPIPARYFAVVEANNYYNALNIERDLHRRFSERRVSGEWYRFDFDSPEDKHAFNYGTGCVLARYLTKERGDWWTKISVKALDAHQREKRQALLKSGQMKKLARRRESERARKRAWAELS